MRTRLGAVNGRARPCAVALGMFDGMHIGHRAVIEQAVRLACARGWRCVVFTFENHPRALFGGAPTPLMGAAARRAAMLKLGVDAVDMVVFDEAMAAMSPEAFVEALRARYDLGAVVAGSDFTFGHGGVGTIETLRAQGKAHGFDVCEVAFVMYGGEKVSSTRVREALERGDTALSEALLGHHRQTVTPPA